MIAVINSNGVFERLHHLFRSFRKYRIYNDIPEVFFNKYDIDTPFILEDTLIQALRQYTPERLRHITSFTNVTYSNDTEQTVKKLAQETEMLVTFSTENFQYTTNYKNEFTAFISSLKQVYKNDLKIIYFYETEDFLLSSFINEKLDNHIKHNATAVELIRHKNYINKRTNDTLNAINESEIQSLTVENFFTKNFQINVIQLCRFLNARLPNQIHTLNTQTDYSCITNISQLTAQFDNTEYKNLLR